MTYIVPNALSWQEGGAGKDLAPEMNGMCANGTLTRRAKKTASRGAASGRRKEFVNDPPSKMAAPAKTQSKRDKGMTTGQPDRLVAGGENRRKSKRYLVEDQPTLTATSGGRLYTCRIQDVSMDGIRLRFDGQIPRGKVIALDHPSAGTLCGVCIWRDSDTMGVELQLPQRELERLLKCICLVL